MVGDRALRCAFGWWAAATYSAVEVEDQPVSVAAAYVADAVETLDWYVQPEHGLVDPCVGAVVGGRVATQVCVSEHVNGSCSTPGIQTIEGQVALAQWPRSAQDDFGGYSTGAASGGDLGKDDIGVHHVVLLGELLNARVLCTARTAGGEAYLDGGAPVIGTRSHANVLGWVARVGGCPEALAGGLVWPHRVVTSTATRATAKTTSAVWPRREIDISPPIVQFWHERAFLVDRERKPAPCHYGDNAFGQR